MLYELETLEAGHIADLALDARKARDRLLEKIREVDLREPVPVRGEHNPIGDLPLNGEIEAQPEFVTLRQAIAAMPRDIRVKVWGVMHTGRGDITIREWNETISAASLLTDYEIAADLLEDADLHDHVRKGLYKVGVTRLPGDGH